MEEIFLSPFIEEAISSKILPEREFLNENNQRIYKEFRDIVNKSFENEVEQHRQIYPLPFQQICKLSSFEQILGRQKSDYTEVERKVRWDKAMDIPGGKRVKEYYSNLCECVDCKHFKNGWCGYASLPCGVNPILTYRDGSLGMACLGVGHELIEGSQMQIEFNV